MHRRPKGVDSFTGKDVFRLDIGDGAIVWTPKPGKRIWLTVGFVCISTPGTVTFEDDAGRFLFRTKELEADWPYNIAFSARGATILEAGRSVRMIGSVPGMRVIGAVIGYEEDVQG